MTRLIAFTLMPALLFSLGGSATAASEAATALQVCGRLVEHRPATATAAGSVTLGTRTYAVAPGTVAGNGGVEIAVGRDLCFEGSLGTTSRQLLRYLFFPLPRDQLCGTVRLASGDALTMASDFGALTILRGPGVPAPATGDRVCYAFQISAQGDAVATRVETVDTKIEREWISHCGTVRAYRPATASAGGTIAIGSKTFTIRAGVLYTGDPAGDRTDRTTPGSNMCLNGVFGPARELIEYLTGAMPTNIVGRTVEYTPPAGGVAGLAVLSYRSQYELRIPAAIDAAVDLVRSSTCFETGVDAAGDIAARTIIPCEPGRAAGSSATGTPSPAVATSPSPSATASASPTPTPNPTASATLPSGDVTTSTTVRVGPDPLLLAGAMGIAALGILAIYLARRRVR